MHRNPVPEAPPAVAPRRPDRRTNLAVRISGLALLLLLTVLATAAFKSGFHLLDFYRSCHFPPCYTDN